MSFHLRGSNLLVDLLDAAENADRLEPAEVRDLLGRAAKFVSDHLVSHISEEGLQLQGGDETSAHRHKSESNDYRP